MGRLVDPDSAKPTEIEHKCDEIFDGGTLQQKYNYFVYHFERDGRYFWARTYVEEIGTVSVYEADLRSARRDHPFVPEAAIRENRYAWQRRIHDHLVPETIVRPVANF